MNLENQIADRPPADRPVINRPIHYSYAPSVLEYGSIYDQPQYDPIVRRRIPEVEQCFEKANGVIPGESRIKLFNITKTRDIMRPFVNTVCITSDQILLWIMKKKSL